MYSQTHDTIKVAKYFYCCADTVRLACKQCGIEMLRPNTLCKERYSKKVRLIEENKIF